MLYERWKNLWTRAGGSTEDRADIAAFDKIVLLYQQPGRFHHTLALVGHSLTEFDAVREHAESPDAVEMALWFQATANVGGARCSAVIARFHLRSGGFPKAFRQRVAGNLVSIAPDRASDADGRLTADLHNAILGQKDERYDDFTAHIRQENAGCSPSEFAEQRIEAIEKFLKIGPVFQSPVMAAKYETAAQANIARELERLRRGVILC